jgi:SAM-dependent methyltransferase
MPRDIDALTSATLKHLRTRWWDAAFTEFLRDTLQPRAGERILDVGCGAAKEKGAVGIDHKPYPGVDIIHDLNRYPWPIGEDRFDGILCRDVVEHLNDVVSLIEELHRVSKPGGRIKIWTPHFAHPNSYRDPTHKYHFSYGTFDYFTGEIDYPIYSQKKFRMVEKRFIFRKKYSIGGFLAMLSSRRYEKYYCHHYPPHGLYFELEVIK